MLLTDSISHETVPPDGETAIAGVRPPDADGGRTRLWSHGIETGPHDRHRSRDGRRARLALQLRGVQRGAVSLARGAMGASRPYARGSRAPLEDSLDGEHRRPTPSARSRHVPS